MAREVLGQSDARREVQAFRHDAMGRRRGAQVGGGGVVVLQQPQHAAVDAGQDAHPRRERGRHDLVGVVEAREHHRIRRQAQLGARGQRGDRAAPIVGLVAVRQVQHVLDVRALLAFGNHVRVGDDRVQVGRAQRAREAEVVHLHRRRPAREHAGAAQAEPAVEVHEDVDAAVGDGLRRGGVGEPGDVDDLVERGVQAPAQRAAVVPAVVERDDLEALAVVQLEQLHREDGCGLVAELAAEVADSDLRVREPRAGRHQRGLCGLRGELVGREQLGAAPRGQRIGGDGRVGEGLDGRAAVGQPLRHLGDERLEAAPVAGHRLCVEALADDVRPGRVQRLHAFERERRLVVALEVEQRVAAIAHDAGDVGRGREHRVEIGDGLGRPAQRGQHVAALDAGVQARGIELQAAAEGAQRVLVAPQRQQRAAPALVRRRVLRLQAQRRVEVGQRLGGLLQREPRRAAADDGVRVGGHQRDGALVARKRLVVAGQVLQHAAAVVVGLSDVCAARDHRVVGGQRVGQPAGRVQHVAAVVGRLDVVRPQRQRAIERRDRLVVAAQRTQRVAAVVERLQHVGLDRQRALQALQRIVVAAQRMQRVAEVAVRARVVRVDRQGLRDEVGCRLRMTGLEGQHPEAVQGVDMARRTAQHLAVDGLGLRDAAAVVQGLGLRHQLVQRGDRAERRRAQEGGWRGEFLGHGSGSRAATIVAGRAISGSSMPWPGRRWPRARSPPSAATSPPSARRPRRRPRPP